MEPIIIWDLEDDEEGNYWHIVITGLVSQEETEEVLRDRKNNAIWNEKHQTWNTYGWTSEGNYLLVAWRHVQENPLTIYPVTAYPVPEPRSRKHGRK